MCQEVNAKMQEYYEEESSEEFYNEDSLFDLVDNDEINGAEEGFMLGYMGS